MNSKSDEKLLRAQKTVNLHGGLSRWIVIACGALLGTLSIRFGCKLKQVLLDKQTNGSANTSRAGHARRSSKRRSGSCSLHSNAYCSAHEEDGYCHCFSETNLDPNGASTRDADPLGCQLVVITSAPAEVFESQEKEVPAIWALSTEHIELPRRPFHRSTGSDSPCVSESGSDIFSKREVIHKLRQQLKKRDEMILEIQARITEQQKFMNEHMRHTTHLQSQLDAANRDLPEAEKEIQRLRKAIADHCASGDSRSHYDLVSTQNRQLQNGYVNGVVGELEAISSSAVGMPVMDEDREADGERVDMLKREVAELREVMEGKDYLLQSYKEQKMELSLKVKELQLRLDSQLPNIL